MLLIKTTIEGILDENKFNIEIVAQSSSKETLIETMQEEVGKYFDKCDECDVTDTQGIVIFCKGSKRILYQIVNL